MSARTSLARALVLAALAIGAACTDPVVDETIEALGEESAAIPVGPLHRAGQRCVVCHQPGGEASGSPLSLAGTVFAQPKRQVGVNEVTVRFTDASGATFATKTNCVGNFFVKPSEFAPRFPILVAIAKNDSTRAMQSPIGREPDCAACHSLGMPPADPLSTVPHIYLFDGDERGAVDGDIGCPVSPIREGTQ